MDESHDIGTAAGTNGSPHVNGSASPVLAATEARPIERAQPSALPSPAVVATGGALMAVVGYVLVRVLRRPSHRRGTVRLGRGRRRGAFEVTGSRSFLVDVHMLKK